MGHAFRELPAGVDESHHVAEGYDAEVLIRWGDPLVPGLAPFDPQTLRAGEQAQRFGYNNDYIAFFPLDETGARGLLCVNHEYTSPEVIFPGVARPDRNGFADMAEARVAVEMAAGVSVVEIALIEDRWVTVLDSTSNRRVLATTPMTVDGPAAGSRPDAHVRRSNRPPGARDAQQLRRRPDPVGDISDGRGELPRLFLDRPDGRDRQAQNERSRRRARRSYPAMASRQAGTTGARTSAASTSTRSPTSPIASAGSSRSTPSIRRPRPSSTPRSDASATRAPS